MNCSLNFMLKFHIIFSKIFPKGLREIPTLPSPINKPLLKIKNADLEHVSGHKLRPQAIKTR